MELKGPRALALYRASADELPSAQMDAFVLNAARASPARMRPRRELLIAGTAVAAVAALFFVRVATTPTQNFASNGNGREEGLARAWLMDLDLQKPTGPGSQEGLP